jgi:hypothetical protein
MDIFALFHWQFFSVWLSKFYTIFTIPNQFLLDRGIIGLVIFDADCNYINVYHKIYNESFTMKQVILDQKDAQVHACLTTQTFQSWDTEQNISSESRNINQGIWMFENALHLIILCPWIDRQQIWINSKIVIWPQNLTI